MTNLNEQTIIDFNYNKEKKELSFNIDRDLNSNRKKPFLYGLTNKTSLEMLSYKIRDAINLLKSNDELLKDEIDNVINNQVLVNANMIVNKLFDIASYSFDEVAENLRHDSEEFESYGYETQEEFEDSGSIYKEIFENYIVDEYLYNELDNIDACVAYIDELDIYIWGRCETGQSMTMDYDIKRVCEARLKRKGA